MNAIQEQLISETVTLFGADLPLPTYKITNIPISGDILRIAKEAHLINEPELALQIIDERAERLTKK